MTPRAVQTTMAGTHRKLRALVSYETSPRINRHEPPYQPSRARHDHRNGSQCGRDNPKDGRAVPRGRHNHYHDSHYYCRVGYKDFSVGHK